MDPWEAPNCHHKKSFIFLYLPKPLPNPPMIKSYNICTYNTNLKFHHTIYLNQILQFCTSNNIHIICLQETGTKIPVLPLQSTYKYIFQLPSTRNHPPNHTTGILIHKSLFSTITKITYHDQGRFTSVQISLPSEQKMRVTSVYLPTGTQTLPLGHPNTQLGLEIVNQIAGLPPSDFNILCGDLNESEMKNRVSSNPARYHSPRFLRLLETQNYI